MGTGIYRETWAEINLNCIAHNVSQVKKRIGVDVKLMAVVKADAYGHGVMPVSQIALEAGADVLGVATLDEALALRRGFVDCPIMVLGYVAPEFAALAALEHITLTVISVAHAKALVAAVASSPLEVHLKFDTGMGRLGLCSIQDLDDVVYTLGESPVTITGAFTHFAQADSLDKQHARTQLKAAHAFFQRLAKKVRNPDRLLLHAANSAAIIDLPESYFEMVRLGISLYGVYPSDEVIQASLPLKQALRLCTRIVHLKTVPKGTTIGYGSTFVTKTDTAVGTLPIGYADGLPRGLSNRGYVLVKGIRCPIIGRVCMDQCMIDVTSVTDLAVGQEVIVYDQDTLAELSALAGTIPYELLCAVSKRVPRRYLWNGDVIDVRNPIVGVAGDELVSRPAQ